MAPLVNAGWLALARRAALTCRANQIWSHLPRCGTLFCFALFHISALMSTEANTYDPQQIESAAQHYWDSTRAFEVNEHSDKPKYYCLSMLPYPSGALHMGHVRNYTIGDVISRYKRMTGHNVLQPMGWDAFGLPAENAAIKNKVAPAQWTYKNIEHMRTQLKSLGYAIDWSREFTTCQPHYYVHEQQMFTRLMRKGLAYRRHALVNWDPVDQTVLANEQVIDGRGWRSGARVEKREIPQWFLRITDYAQELLDDLNTLDGWPEPVKTMQRNWIGRSEGLEIQFEVRDPDNNALEALRVFTTRPDTLLGVTFVSIAAEHPLALHAAKSKPELATLLAEMKQGGLSEVELKTQEKRGMDTGLKAIHPITSEPLPVWVANFVLMAYGTGAVMGVPGHDQRDQEFANKYGLPIHQVIALKAPKNHDERTWEPNVWRDWYGDKTREFELVNSAEFDGLDYQSAFEVLAERFERQGRGQRRVNYRLRDWGVSRQRYWGCPIPVIYCSTCGAVPVPEDQLPVILPENVAFSSTGSPLKTDPEWRKTTCPECGGPAERETDTFDTFMESSWYYARYTSPEAREMVDKRANYWLPVDQYIGGIEHAILHLMYFRFYHKLMRDARLVDSNEPAINLLTQGMVIAETFYRQNPDGSKDWINPTDVNVERDERGRITGAILISDGKPVMIGATEKMSKSKNNGVDPQAMVSKYGADTVRLFSMFAAPPEQSLEWNEAGVEGMARFLRRLWAQVHHHAAHGPPTALDITTLDAAQKAIRCKTHETIARVADDYSRRRSFNTAIAAIMELSNTLARFDDTNTQSHAVRQEALETMVLLLNPITPHTSHALWQTLGHPETLLEDQPFPKVDSTALVREAVTLAVQVNGKLRGTIEVAADAARENIETNARDEPNTAKFLQGLTVLKIIIVPGKIVNIVTS
ncbi:leucyl-tRNA synthetase [Xylella taiwanensis]|uniref:Leucine--tRNA ligase n=2 Tax=Xylella taiwanensis TaxID=1444770 RepID=Z9JHB3_9GAMM|nr:leucyl-tRNA synthetase [Xylella taiwanensis]